MLAHGIGGAQAAATARVQLLAAAAKAEAIVAGESSVNSLFGGIVTWLNAGGSDEKVKASSEYRILRKRHRGGDGGDGDGDGGGGLEARSGGEVAAACLILRNAGCELYYSTLRDAVAPASASATTAAPIAASLAGAGGATPARARRKATPPKRAPPECDEATASSASSEASATAAADEATAAAA